MKTMTRVLLATALLSVVGCKSELDGKPVAKVGDAKGDAKPATDAKADANASSIGFVGAKITGDHKGDFKTFTGEATVAGTVPQSVKFSIETGSVTSDAEDLTTHLKSPDFFDVAKFPKAEFSSTKVEAKAAGDANYEITGDLDLHGVKKSITFPAKITVDERGAKGTTEFKINRKDFQIVYAGKADDLIKDEVLLKISLAFTG